MSLSTNTYLVHSYYVFASDASCSFYFLKGEIEDWILEEMEKLSVIRDAKRSGFGVWYFKLTKFDIKIGDPVKISL